MANRARKLKYQQLVEDWIQDQGWSDEVDLDIDMSIVRLKTGIKANSQNYSLFIEARGKTDLIQLYLYPPFNVSAEKTSEALILINEINLRIYQGRFAMMSDGRIQYKHCIDVEDMTPSVEAIGSMVSPAWRWCEKWDAALAAVALTRQTAGEVLRNLAEEEARFEIVPDQL
jgi:hypothetical protein